MNIIILISTPDSRGLVHKISSNLLDFNIEKNDEFVDRESGQFFMRTEISLDSANSASCGDFSQLHSPRFLDEPCVLSSSLNSHNCENSSTILEFASCKNAESSNTIQSKKPFKSFCYFWLSPKVESSLLLNPNLPNNADSTDSQNLGENNRARSSHLESRPLRGAKNRNQASSSASADFLLEAEKRGSPPKSEKAELFGAQGERGGGCSPFCKKESKLSGENSVRVAESALDSAESQNLKSGLPREQSSLAMTKNKGNAESTLDSANAIKDEIYHRLCAILPKNSFLKVTLKRKKSLIIFATKESHCLGDLLLKNYNNELNIEIKAVLSNHGDLGALVEKFNIPYFHISHDEANYEDKMLQICQDFAPDFIVLAKYMRILRPKFIAHYENRIINIHHSFLPAFIGANPYKQAYNRGVKIIGATAHFVTSELDSGPIICQDILQVNHTLLWRDMQKAGKNIERVVLARAVELAISERIFIHNNKTIIF